MTSREDAALQARKKAKLRAVMVASRWRVSSLSASGDRVTYLVPMFIPFRNQKGGEGWWIINYFVNNPRRLAEDMSHVTTLPPSAKEGLRRWVLFELASQLGAQATIQALQTIEYIEEEAEPAPEDVTVTDDIDTIEEPEGE